MLNAYSVSKKSVTNKPIAIVFFSLLEVMKHLNVCNIKFMLFIIVTPIVKSTNEGTP